MILRIYSLTALIFLASPPFFANAMLEKNKTEEEKTQISFKEIDDLIKNEKFEEAADLLLKEASPQVISGFCNHYTQLGKFNVVRILLTKLLKQKNNELNNVEKQPSWDLKNNKKLKDSLRKIIDDFNYRLGENYRTQGKYEEAIEAYNQMETYDKTSQKNLEYYLAKGHCYVGLYLNKGYTEYKDEAFDNYKDYLDIYREFTEEKQEDVKKNYGYFLCGLIQIYLKNKDYINAKIRHDELFTVALTNDSQEKAYMDLVQAEIHIELKEDEAIKDSFNKLNDCIEYFRKTNGIEGLTNAYFLRSKIDHEGKEDDYKKALDLVKKYGFEQFKRFVTQINIIDRENLENLRQESLNLRLRYEMEQRIERLWNQKN
jgi:tetratricopeptide (TPR) repeat protein